MSHSFAGTVEAGERQELRQVWLTSMRLLGFDSAHEEKMKVALGRDMFAHINKKGSEIVLYFLFSRLDSHMAYEEFRYENSSKKKHVMAGACTTYIGSGM